MDDLHKPTWMLMFDKQECKDVWDILSANGTGEIDNAETLKRLKEIDYEKLNITDEGIINHIDMLMGKKKNEPVLTKVEDVKEAKRQDDIKGIANAVDALNNKANAEIKAIDKQKGKDGKETKENKFFKKHDDK